MIIYFDENFPPHLARGFEILQKPESQKMKLQTEVRFLPDIFGRGAKDEHWIPEIGKNEDCIITQDVNITRRKHELELYRQNKIGLFLLRGPSKKAGLKIWDMVLALAKNWPELLDKAHNYNKPFAFNFGLKGKPRQIE